MTRSCNEAPSLYRDFIRHASLLLSEVPGFTNIDGRYGEIDEHFISSIPKLWSIPSASDVDYIIDDSYAKYDRQKHRWTMLSDHYAISAASTAIAFLEPLKPETRRSLRNVRLVEYSEVVAFPECHARGLIPSCRENSDLKVCILSTLWTCLVIHNLTLFGKPELGERIEPYMLHKSIAPWMAEAATLPYLGMPKDQFTLVFDGEPYPELAAEAFDFVSRASAEQAAMDECQAQGLFAPQSWAQRRAMRNYTSECLPTILKEIANDQGIVCCNSPLWSERDIEQVVSLHADFTLVDWEEDDHIWFENDNFDGIASLPFWKERLEVSVLHRWERVIQLPDPTSSNEILRRGSHNVHLYHHASWPARTLQGKDDGTERKRTRSLSTVEHTYVTRKHADRDEASSGSRDRTPGTPKGREMDSHWQDSKPGK
ncbi:hypothetical protein E8E11_000609 [Didymella keratinophila]|nr:hypothetical protein E8E11_000609 [Didymella keratinophila]